MGDIKKRILLLSTSDTNGAAEYIFKVAQLFVDKGHIVAMLVKHKTQHDNIVIQYQPINNIKRSLLIRIWIKLKNYFQPPKKNNISFDSNFYFFSKDETSVNISVDQVIKQIGFIPEYIFSGITYGFMNSTDLLYIQQFSKAAVYNITVDMNHFTGGCHYAWDCKGYITGCDENCPAIINKDKKKLAQINFETKYKNAKLGNFKILTGSGWTIQQASLSKIYKNQTTIFNINSLIDTKIMHNRNRTYAKDIFNLDKNKFYMLMGCQNAIEKRKGFEYLIDALNILNKNITDEQRDTIEVLIVSTKISNSFNDIPFQKKHINYIKDYRLLSLLYQASDVFINTSIEDSGPMMVTEALACGTPVVGFDMGIVNNMVINNYNGYKAKLKDSHDLAFGIKLIFELSKEAYNKYSDNSVKQVVDFSSFEYANKVFNEIF